jgi:hypothetical protein
MKHDRWQIISDDSVWMFPADITLSTVELSKITFGENEDHYLYGDTPYESCMFHANGDSYVICRYQTKELAMMGHEELEKKYGLKRCSKLRI